MNWSTDVTYDQPLQYKAQQTADPITEQCQLRQLHRPDAIMMINAQLHLPSLLLDSLSHSRRKLFLLVARPLLGWPTGGARSGTFNISVARQPLTPQKLVRALPCWSIKHFLFRHL